MPDSKPPTPRIRSIIFDLDGTLLDSSRCVIDAAQNALETHGFSRSSPETILNQVGLPLECMMETIAPDAPPEDHQRLMATYRDAYPSIAAEKERLFPDATAILDLLVERGFVLAVATGKSHEGAWASVRRRGIQSYFTAIHGIVPGTPGKPHPALLHRVLDELETEPAQSVLIGDTTFDVEMAHRARVLSCGVTWGVHSKRSLESQNPAQLVDSFDELSGWILEGFPV